MRFDKLSLGCSKGLKRVSVFITASWLKRLGRYRKSAETSNCFASCRIWLQLGTLNFTQAGNTVLLDFEHIVQVNEPENDAITDISRSQLWQGLVLRARSPEKFNPSLTCQSRPVAPNEFLRTIHVGDSNFCEHVILYPENSIHTITVPEFQQIEAESEARIEEPQAGYLFVRFRYKREIQKEDEQVNIEEHLKSAYVQMDRDAIAMIRDLAESESANKS